MSAEMGADRLVELSLGFRPEAAISGAVLVQTEASVTLTFNAMRPSGALTSWGAPMMERAGTAIFRFEGCALTRFGHPNDEARPGVPRLADAAIGIYEVPDSAWAAEVVEANRGRFPATPDGAAGRHLVFAFHDSTFECLTRGFTFELSDEPYADILARIHQQVCAE